MTADATIAAHHKALLDLLTVQAPSRPAEARILTLLDAAMTQLALEGAAIQVLTERTHVDVREHTQAHGRARLALFRIATSPSDSSAVARALDELRDAFGHRPQILAGQLAKHLDVGTLDRLAHEMKDLSLESSR